MTQDHAAELALIEVSRIQREALALKEIDNGEPHLPADPYKCPVRWDDRDCAGLTGLSFFVSQA